MRFFIQYFDINVVLSFTVFGGKTWETSVTALSLQLMGIRRERCTSALKAIVRDAV